MRGAACILGVHGVTPWLRAYCDSYGLGDALYDEIDESQSLDIHAISTQISTVFLNRVSAMPIPSPPIAALRDCTEASRVERPSTRRHAATSCRRSKVGFRSRSRIRGVC